MTTETTGETTLREWLSKYLKWWVLFWAICTVLNFGIATVYEIKWDTTPGPVVPEFSIEAVYSVNGDVESAVFWTTRETDWSVKAVSGELMHISKTETDVTKTVSELRQWPDEYPGHTGESLKLVDIQSTKLPYKQPSNLVPIISALWMEVIGTVILILAMFGFASDRNSYSYESGQGSV